DPAPALAGVVPDAVHDPLGVVFITQMGRDDQHAHAAHFGEVNLFDVGEAGFRDHARLDRARAEQLARIIFHALTDEAVADRVLAVRDARDRDVERLAVF